MVQGLDSGGTLQIQGFSDPAAWRDLWERKGLRGCCRRLLSSAGYDYFISLVVVANCLLIGWEQSSRLEEADVGFFQDLETGFVVFYLVELLLVLGSFGARRALRSNWVRLDVLLALVGVASQLVLILHRNGQELSNSLSVMLLMRIARVLGRMLRLARTMRVMVRFRGLWLLAEGFLSSFYLLFHTLLLGVVLLYVLGCVAMELIPLSMDSGGLSEDLRASMESHFRSLPMTMLTLVQFVTFDSAYLVYKPWIEAQPHLAVFFVATLLVMGVVFMNLVTAIIVNSALENATQNHHWQQAVHEEDRKELLRKLQIAFEAADKNCSGELSREELKNLGVTQQYLLKTIMGSGRDLDIVRLFDYLDVDGDGQIGISEFCNGIEGLVLSETPLEVKRIERMVESMRKQLRETRRAQESIIRSLRNSALDVHSDASPRAHMEDISVGTESGPLGRPSSAARSCASQKTEDNLCSIPGIPCLMPSWAKEMIGSLRELSEKLDEAMPTWAAVDTPAHGSCSEAVLGRARVRLCDEYDASSEGAGLADDEEGGKCVLHEVSTCFPSSSQLPDSYSNPDEHWLVEDAVTFTSSGTNDSVEVHTSSTPPTLLMHAHPTVPPTPQRPALFLLHQEQRRGPLLAAGGAALAAVARRPLGSPFF